MGGWLSILTAKAAGFVGCGALLCGISFYFRSLLRSVMPTVEKDTIHHDENKNNNTDKYSNSTIVTGALGTAVAVGTGCFIAQDFVLSEKSSTEDSSGDRIPPRLGIS